MGLCAREQRLGSHATNGTHLERNKRHDGAANLVTVTDRTKTYRFWTAVSDPSEVGSEPDSRLS